MHLAIAWRNIWRNPRRTAVLLAAIVVGVWAMVFLGALMRGIADQMVRNSIATLTGDIQIHAPGYRDDPVIENGMSRPAALYRTLDTALPAGGLWTSRVRVNAIASNARHTSGVTLVGIVPEREGKVSFLGGALAAGRMLASGDGQGIVIGRALADQFETALGKKIILMSQDTEREIASRSFRIVGIFRAEMEATEKAFVFVDIAAAREMLKLGDGISEVSILLPGRDMAEGTARDLRSSLPGGVYEVSTWQEIIPFMTAILKIYDWFIFIWFLVIFIAMGFGIVNTTLMAVFERVREFGLLKALGMKPWWIVRSVLLEALFLLLIGMAAGDLLGIAGVSALAETGIDLSAYAKGAELAQMSRIIYPALQVGDVVLANLVVLVLGLAVSAYPAVKAARFAPVQAMAWT